MKIFHVSLFLFSLPNAFTASSIAHVTAARSLTLSERTTSYCKWTSLLWILSFWFTTFLRSFCKYASNFMINTKWSQWLYELNMYWRNGNMSFKITLIWTRRQMKTPHQSREMKALSRYLSGLVCMRIETVGRYLLKVWT